MCQVHEGRTLNIVLRNICGMNVFSIETFPDHMSCHCWGHNHVLGVPPHVIPKVTRKCPTDINPNKEIPKR